MAFFDKISKAALDMGKSVVDTVTSRGKDLMDKAKDKLAYSEEDIAERRKKDGIVYVFDGGNGTLLEVYSDRVTLFHNKSLFGSFAGFAGETVGEKTLYVTDLTSVEFKEAQKLCIGYIRFSVLNGSNARKTTADAAEDPNAVTIALVEKNAEAAEIKSYIEKMIIGARKGGGTTTINQTLSNADELKKYKDLLDTGIITQEEFDAKKKQLLGL